MSPNPNLNRRFFIGAAAAAPAWAVGGADAAPGTLAAATPLQVSAAAFGISPQPIRDQTALFQAAIDQTAAHGATLVLPPGRYVVGGLVLRPGTRLAGTAGASVLSYSGSGVCVSAEHAAGITLTDLDIDGGARPLDRARTSALLRFDACPAITLSGVRIGASAANGLHLTGCSGRVTACVIAGVEDAGLWSEDADLATGALEITATAITDCGDNGLLVWRTERGDDGTRISDCRISRIGNRSGGRGQYGNGINVFRAANVTIANTRITDCAYSGIRGNAAGNIQMLGNHVQRCGEVALYAEFGFVGAMISNNIVDGAATGIAVTNFNAGGRLAVVQGNLIRNLFRRAHEAVDTRGEGIVVEADAVVSNNVIEGAPAAGLRLGWGPYLRDVAATGNVIRACGIGIAVSGDAGKGPCLIANNLISGHTEGAIRAMDFGRAVGRDLIGDGADVPRHVRLAGNVG